MADQDICQRWLKVTKPISINDYNHKLKENNTRLQQHMMKCHLKKSIREAFLMKEATSIQQRSFTCAGLLIKVM